MAEKIIYLDHNATTPVSPEVRQAMLPYLGEAGFNPSSAYRPAQKVRAAVDRARCDVAALLACEPEEVTFTSGATESCNIAILGALSASDPAHVISVATEHNAVIASCREAERRGHTVSYLDVDRGGRVDPAQLDALRRRSTRLVSVMLANNETGVIQDVSAIGRWCRDHGALFHCDATAAIGKMQVHPHKMPCDFLSLSGHKFHAPKGVGALFVRRGVRAFPVLFGGEQEEGLRPGTENVPGIAGLGAAARLASDFISSGGPARIEKLRADMETRVRRLLPSAEILSSSCPRIVNTSSIRLPGVQNDEVLVSLDREGICVSVGSACSSGASKPSHVVTALGYSAAEGKQVIRVSLGPENTEPEIARFVDALVRAAAKLRADDRDVGRSAA